MSEFGPKAEVHFVALIGDVVASRSSPDREQLQQRLLQETERLNRRLGAALASDLALTAGDEVQGLLRRPEQIVTIVRQLSETILPDRLVFGLGRGGVSTRIYPEVARIDGPCFHLARSALKQHGGDVWVRARGFGPVEDSALEAIFNLMAAIRSRWTAKQLSYTQRARLKPQKEVARDFGVVESTVSESLKAASFAAVLEGEEAARKLLSGFGSEDESGADSVEEAK